MKSKMTRLIKVVKLMVLLRMTKVSKGLREVINLLSVILNNKLSNMMIMMMMLIKNKIGRSGLKTDLFINMGVPICV